MAVRIDSNGLLHGDRINACSKMAQLYYPRMLAASNSCGRIRIEYNMIVAAAFPDWKPKDIPSPEELMEYFREYARHRLLFPYTIEGHIWGQWDGKPGTFGRYQKRSEHCPAPPPEEFRAWLERNREDSLKADTRIGYLSGNGSAPKLAPKLAQNSRQNLRKVGAKVGAKISPENPVPEKSNKSKPSAKPAPADQQIYSEYPRKEGRGAALKAIAKARARLAGGEQDGQPINTDQAQALLLERTQVYARSPRGQAGPDPTNGPATPHPSTWFNQSRYLDDEKLWHVTPNGAAGGGNHHGRHQQDNADIERAAEAATEKFLRGQDVLGGEHVQFSTPPKFRDPG